MIDQTITTNITKELLESVERDLLDLITKHLEDNTLSLEKAQGLSKEFLAILPIHDKIDLLNKMGTLSQKYAEAQTVYAKYAGTIDNEDRQEKLDHMSELIKLGKVEEAIAVAKKGVGAS